jgi:hypothetical protein
MNKLLIAHRGLIDGPNSELENHPNHIKMQLDNKISCEIDVWYCNSSWWLGHDLPKYSIDINFLKQENLWIHAKNLDALYNLRKLGVNYFWHQSDDYTLTSFGYIWAYPGKELTEMSIAVMPEYISDEYWYKCIQSDCLGICTDYVNKLKSEIA